MGTIKKSDFKKAVKEGKTVDELVDDDGGIISGDEKFNKGIDVKTGPINKGDDEKGIATTTDDHRSTAIQPRNWWWSLSYGYGQGKGKSPIGSNIGTHGDSYFGESLDESELTEEQMMRKMVEDILGNKTSNKDIVKKRSNSDVNRKEIPDVEKIEDTKMIVVGKVKDMIESMEGGNLSGDELAIILNYMLKNLDTNKIPSDYKNLLKKLI